MYGLSKKEQNKFLSWAIREAVLAHDGVYLRDDKPYILHPLYVMEGFMNEPMMAALAISHDVVEDNPNYTIDYYRRMGFPEEWLISLNYLTHKPEDSYDSYISRIALDVAATRIKMRDLEHNSKVTRLNKVELTKKDFDRINKYARSYVYLSRVQANRK